MNNQILLVPCGSIQSYTSNSSFSTYPNIRETCIYTVNTTSNNEDAGGVWGGGEYNFLDTVVLYAIPTHNHLFVGWDNGQTLNPYQIVVTKDTSINAIFAERDTTYINIHDTTYIDVPYAVHDTTYINVHDTTYIDVPYAVHDTTYINVHDTTFIDVPYAVHDTTYINVHDTTYIDVPYAVHDTTYINVHDTTYIDVPYAVHDTTYINVHDTTYIDVPYAVHDTTYITLTDTITNTVYDTIDNFIHDTTIVTDTLWLTQYDSLWLHDTIIVHDTIYITQEGIGDVEAVNAKVYSHSGQIVVEGAEGHAVTLYDINGRLLATRQEEFAPLHFDVPASGTYMLRIGNLPARKVVVIR